MNRISAIVVALLFCSFATPTHAEIKNVVLILADDLGYMDIGCLGSQYYETPRLDELAHSGMIFTNGYAACQVCSPSRASLMTGKTPARHGITDYIGAKTGYDFNRNNKVLPATYKPHLPFEEQTIAEVLKANGYRTFMAGKWHLGDVGSWPTDHGFEFNAGGHKAGTPPGGYFAPFKNPALKDKQLGESLPMRLAEETASFIREHKSEKFFVYLSFYSVHGPIQTTQKLWTKYQKKAMEQGAAENFPKFHIDRTKPVRLVQDNPIYAGMMETMDKAVGRVLDELKAQGLDEETMVVFTSDNGGVSSGDAYSTSMLPLRGGKGRQWEGGIREPFFVRAPGVTEAGSTSDQPVIGMDLYPTILELTGLPLMPKQHVDGISLTPALKGKALPERNLYWHYPHYGNQGGEPSAIVRSGDWKLIHYFEDGRDELYNLKTDIGEHREMSIEHPELAASLRQDLNAFLKESGALIPEKDPRYDAEKAVKQAEQMRTKTLQRLEKQHANFLNPNFNPNKNWWGSMISED